MQIDLEGKTALVTGGNTGIGRDIAIQLARCGAEVAITYYSNDSGDTASVINQSGGKAVAFQLDATDSEAVDRVIAATTDAFGQHIDILVNNAGGLIARQTVADMTDDHWHKVINLNLSSMFYCTRAVLPYMNTGWGRIINIASGAAFTGGGKGSVVYATAKAGMLGFARGLAKEQGNRGITVNVIAPGMILETPFHEKFTTDDRIQATIANTPVGRVGNPADVSSAVLYLASEGGGFVSGEVIVLSGGAFFG